jgi:hypothetical protein
MQENKDRVIYKENNQIKILIKECKMQENILDKY